MPIKCTLLCQLSTNPSGASVGGPHIAGWSESLYTNVAIDIAKARFQDVCNSRASLLPPSAAIVGQRYQVVGGGSTTALNRFPGTAPVTGIPQKALLCTAQAAGFANVRRFSLRGIPDDWIVEGELKLNAAFNARFANYRASILANGTFVFRARDLTAVEQRIVSIDATGLVKTFAEIGAIAIGDTVILKNVVTTNGISRGGRYRVTAVVNPANSKEFTIAGWALDVVADSGTAARYAIVYPGPITAVDYARAVSRKVGRPFEQYRGRSSRRR